MIPERFAEFVARLRRGSGERDRARLAAVLELNRALAKAPDRRTLLELLLDEAVRLFAAERGFVLLAPDAGTDRLRVAAARTLDRESVQHAEKKVSSTVVDRCLRDGRAVLSEDAQAGDFAASRSVADLKLRSVLAVPLRAAELTLGCLYLDHRFHAGVFGVDDLPWLEAFADQAAIALHLHALLEQVRAHSRRVESDNLRLAAEVAVQTERVTRLQAELTRGGLRHAYDEILGDSPAVLRLLHLLDRVVDGEYPVLLVGESGTGKELLARSIHERSGRRSGPFVAVNCAAIPETILESELFGHERGAFTGAIAKKDGRFAKASGGTLFLDEIGELSPQVQVKLLRVLQEGEYEPLGGSTVRADARIVAATNRDLSAEVQAGRFREDLFYRLNVIAITAPPLRARREDVPLLVDHFVGMYCAKNGKARLTVARPALDKLLDYSWPGNVRELENVIERAVVLSRSDTLTELDLPESIAKATPQAAESFSFPVGTPLDQIELRVIRETLRFTKGDKSLAAQLLGISTRTIYRKIDGVAESVEGEVSPETRGE